MGALGDASQTARRAEASAAADGSGDASDTPHWLEQGEAEFGATSALFCIGSSGAKFLQTGPTHLGLTTIHRLAGLPTLLCFPQRCVCAAGKASSCADGSSLRRLFAASARCIAIELISSDESVFGELSGNVWRGLRRRLCFCCPSRTCRDVSVFLNRPFCTRNGSKHEWAFQSRGPPLVHKPV